MREYTIGINKFWNGEDDLWTFRIIVPCNITREKIVEAIVCEYKEQKKNSLVDLLDYVCEKYHWTWLDFDFDIMIQLD